jgi:hypothetical protein
MNCCEKEDGPHLKACPEFIEGVESIFGTEELKKEENYEKIMCDCFGGDVVGITFFGNIRSGDFGDTNSGCFRDIRSTGYEAWNTF